MQGKIFVCKTGAFSASDEKKFQAFAVLFRLDKGLERWRSQTLQKAVAAGESRSLGKPGFCVYAKMAPEEKMGAEKFFLGG